MPGSGFRSFRDARFTRVLPRAPDRRMIASDGAHRSRAPTVG
jgi:hypothetical protein